ncbi:MAG: glycoside hydrolase family 32 protein [Desulfobacteraceae bacterium]|nr:glycoside hydrolase family 32 protein [Desulfobacteraceae bacterium]
MRYTNRSFFRGGSSGFKLKNHFDRFVIKPGLAVKKEKLLVLFAFFIFIFQAASPGVAATYKETQYAANIKVFNNHKSAISDPTYPKYHLRAPSGWINDPCGLFYFNSSFHVFCQSNPWGKQWGNMIWSHMVGDPDKKWSYKWFYPVDEKAIFKTSALMQSLNNNAPDKDGIFTGGVELLPYKEKDKNGKKIVTYYPTAAYSGVWGTDESKQEVICFARALQANKVDGNGNLVDPFLTEWTKYSTTSIDDPNSNPDIIVSQPAELNLISFRDPQFLRFPDDSNFYMIVSGGIKEKDGTPRGVILLFKNDGEDLTKNWQRVNKANNFFFSGKTAVKDPITGGGDYECGVLYRLTDHIGTTNKTPYILVYGQDGPAHKAYGKSIYYVLGHIKKSKEKMKFEPLESFKDSNGMAVSKHLDLNPDFVFYASNIISLDNEQRKYLFGWLNLASQANDGKEYKWAGALSSPRFLFAYKENDKWKLGQEPVLVNALRKKKIFSSKISFSGNTKQISLDDVKGRYINIDTRFEAKNILSAKFGIKVGCSKDKCTKISIEKGKLSLDNGTPIDLNLPENSSQLAVNVYLDGSIMEIFISKYLHTTSIPYKVYSSPLPNNGDLDNNTVKVYGIENMNAEVTVYPMDTCWVKAPALITGKSN